jgi:transposase
MAPACALTSAQPERKKKVAGRRLSPEESQQEQALGTSRGGLGTKIHVLCEGEGRPITFVLTPGQRHESTQVEALLDRVAIGGKPGAPCRRFDTVAGDRGYDYPHTRRQVAQRGSRPLIPHKKRPDGTYPPEAEGFDKEQYRQRNVVERLIGRLKEWRAIATRYEKLAESFRAVLLVGFIMIWVKDLLSYRA